MPKTTSNKSLRITRRTKNGRQATLSTDDIGDGSRVAGASGVPTKRRRPGRAAALLSSSQRTRSQRWRSPAKGSRTMRRGSLGKDSRTGRSVG
jgi:hypothetical protein